MRYCSEILRTLLWSFILMHSDINPSWAMPPQAVAQAMSDASSYSRQVENDTRISPTDLRDNEGHEKTGQEEVDILRNSPDNPDRKPPRGFGGAGDVLYSLPLFTLMDLLSSINASVPIISWPLKKVVATAGMTGDEQTTGATTTPQTSERRSFGAVMKFVQRDDGEPPPECNNVHTHRWQGVACLALGCNGGPCCCLNCQMLNCKITVEDDSRPIPITDEQNAITVLSDDTIYKNVSVLSANQFIIWPDSFQCHYLRIWTETMGTWAFIDIPVNEGRIEQVVVASEKRFFTRSATGGVGSIKVWTEVHGVWSHTEIVTTTRERRPHLLVLSNTELIIAAGQQLFTVSEVGGQWLFTELRTTYKEIIQVLVVSGNEFLTLSYDRPYCMVQKWSRQNTEWTDTVYAQTMEDGEWEGRERLGLRGYQINAMSISDDKKIILSMTHGYQSFDFSGQIFRVIWTSQNQILFDWASLAERAGESADDYRIMPGGQIVSWHIKVIPSHERVNGDTYRFFIRIWTEQTGGAWVASDTFVLTSNTTVSIFLYGLKDGRIIIADNRSYDTDKSTLYLFSQINGQWSFVKLAQVGSGFGKMTEIRPGLLAIFSGSGIMMWDLNRPNPVVPNQEKPMWNVYLPQLVYVPAPIDDNEAARQMFPSPQEELEE